MKNKKGFIIISVFFISIALVAVIGALSLSIMYTGQLERKVVNDVKAYYLAVSGVNYMRQHVYNDILRVIYAGNYMSGYTWDDNKILTDEKTVTFSLEGYSGDVTVGRKGQYLNSEITSTATVEAVSKKVYCMSGDENVPLELAIGVYAGSGLVDNTGVWKYYNNVYIAESQLPVTKWEVKQ